MIAFGPFELGPAMLKGEDAFEHFARFEGRPVAVWKFPSSSADLADSVARTVELQHPMMHQRWLRLDRAGVEDGAPWVCGELVPGIQLGRVLHARRFEDLDRRPPPIAQSVVAGLALSVARALSERARVTLAEGDFRRAGIHTCQWRMRVDHQGQLRLMFEPAMYCQLPPIGPPTDFDLISPELVQPDQLPHRAASDVFQVAAFAGLVLAGDGLFGSDPEQIVERVLSATPLPLDALLPSAEPGFRAVLAEALVRDPSRRTQSLEGLIAQLSAFGSEEESGAWLRDQLEHRHADELRHQERSLAELEGRPPEPIPRELEQRVLASRDHEAAWLVLADWLNAQGFQRGQLAIVQHRTHGHRPVNHEALTPELRTALTKLDRFYWLSDLDVYVHYGYADAIVHPHAELDARSQRYRREMGLRDDPPRPRPRFPDGVERKLFQALSLPMFRFLRAVLIDADCDELDAVVRALAAARHPAVEEIFVPASRVADVEATLRPRLPRLRAVRACSAGTEEERRKLLGYS